MEARKESFQLSVVLSYGGVGGRRGREEGARVLMGRSTRVCSNSYLAEIWRLLVRVGHFSAFVIVSWFASSYRMSLAHLFLF